MTKPKGVLPIYGIDWGIDWLNLRKIFIL